MAHTAEEVKKHVRTYLVVFVALLALTIVTVAASYLDLSTPATITVALVIASIKASLVAAYFMHLIDEKLVIYWVLFITAIFFLVCMFLPVLTESDTMAIWTMGA